MSKPDGHYSAKRIVILYFLGAGTWILGSDLALLAAYPDSASTVIGSLVKGGLFVVFTSALLYFVLRKRPAAETPGEPVGPVGDTQSQGRWPALIPFMLLTAALVSACAWLFVREQHEHRLIAREQLESRAELKAREVGLWLKGEGQGALSYGRARSFQDDLPGMLSGDHDALARVEKRMEAIRRSQDIDAVLVLDPAGRPLVAVGKLVNVSADLARDVAEVAKSRKPRLHVLRHAGPADSAPMVLDQLVPIELDAPSATAPAVIVLRNDATTTLFSMLKHWPVASRTGESYLVRRAGDRIEYLSELRAKPGAPLTLGATVASEGRVSAQLFRGAGFTEKAIDYRGAAVFATSRAVPGTDWRVIAKMDLDEVLEPAREQARVFLVLIVSLTLLAAYGANRMWRQHMQLAALRERAEIAERKRAETKLSESEERYRALFERSLDSVFLIDFEGHFLDANPAALNLLGYSRAELPSATFPDLLHPDDVGRARAAIDKVVHEGPQRTPNEYRLRRKDGGEVIAEVRTTVVFSEGKPSALLGVARDITGRMQAEEKIRRLNRVYAVLSGINTTIVRVKDRQALFNEACRIAVEEGHFAMAWIGTLDQATLEVTPVAWAGESAEGITRVKSSARDGVVAGQGAVGRSIRGRRPVINNDIAAKGFGGPRRQEILKLGFQSQITLPLYEKSAVVGALTIYVREVNFFDEEELRLLTELAGDISFALEVLAGEQARQQTQRELEYQRTMLLTQQEVSPDAILVVDESARIISYNRKFLELWNIPEEMTHSGVDMPVLQTVVGQMQNPDDFLNKVKYLYEHREEMSHDELHTRDGRIIDRHSAPVIGADGKYFGRVWYFRDISERRRNEQALAQSEARFRQMADTMGQVFWMASPDGSSMIYVSPAFEKIWGWTCPELYADPELWMKAIYPEDTPNVVASLERLAQGDAYDIEFRITRHDGALRWINDRGYANRDDAGRVVMTTGIATDVTNRKRFEVELRESERRFSDMLGNVQLVSLMLDRNARITYCNDYLLRLTGRQREEVVGRDWFEVFIPPDHGDVKGVFADLIANQPRAWHHENEILTRSGARRLIRWSNSVLRAPSGEVIGAASIGEDITESKKAEEASARLAAIVEYSSDAIISRGLDRIIHSWNPAAERLFGWKADEVIGRSVALLVPPEREDESVSNREFLAQGADIPTYDTERLTKDGRRIPVSLTHSLIRNPRAELIGVSLAIRDISERMKAEQEKAMLAAIVESSSDAIVSRGMDGKIQSWNAAAERMFGWARQEAIGQPITIVVPPERRGEVRPLIERVIAGETVGAIESVHRRKDGTRIDTSITLSAIRDAKGNVTAVSLIYRDITERKQGEATLHEAEQRFRAMIEQSISGFYLIQDDRFTYVNSRFAEIFGYASADEIVGMHPTELVAANDRATVSRNIQRRLTGEIKSLSYSFTGLRKDGKEIEVGVHGSQATYQGHPVIMGLMQDISERKHAEEEIKRYVARLEQAMQSTINVVATIGELRDPYTHGHERRVGEIAAAIATEMGLDGNQVEGIRIAGYMHDVGKIGVPAEILAKPGKLTKAEYDLVKDHAQQSFEILKTVPFPWPVAETAWQHHERIDGSGYPRGLKGEEIILEARVIAVADTVEAMSSHRPYRPGLGLERALAEIEKGGGKIFDSRVVDACLRLFREKAYTLPA